MNRKVLLAALVVLGAAGAARAQYLPPQVSPYGYGGGMASPYVNLLHQGNPAVNYMGLVQPQLQAQANFQMLQGQAAQRMAPAPVAPPRNGGAADTGYAPARFMQYQQYYMTLSGGQRLNNNPAVNNQTVPGMTAAARFGGR